LARALEAESVGLLVNTRRILNGRDAGALDTEDTSGGSTRIAVAVTVVTALGTHDAIADVQILALAGALAIADPVAFSTTFGHARIRRRIGAMVPIAGPNPAGILGHAGLQLETAEPVHTDRDLQRRVVKTHWNVRAIFIGFTIGTLLDRFASPEAAELIFPAVVHETAVRMSVDRIVETLHKVTGRRLRTLKTVPIAAALVAFGVVAKLEDAFGVRATVALRTARPAAADLTVFTLVRNLFADSSIAHPDRARPRQRWAVRIDTALPFRVTDRATLALAHDPTAAERHPVAPAIAGACTAPVHRAAGVLAHIAARRTRLARAHQGLDLPHPRAAQLFPVALTMTARVVATLRYPGLATRRAARVQLARTNARTPVPVLVARTRHWFRGRRRTPGRVDRGIGTECASNGSRATKT
jgi:hypothetical protein